MSVVVAQGNTFSIFEVLSADSDQGRKGDWCQLFIYWEAGGTNPGQDTDKFPVHPLCKNKSLSNISFLNSFCSSATMSDLQASKQK